MGLAEEAGRGPLTPKQLKEVLRTRENLGGAGEARWLELKRSLASQGHRRREDRVKLLSAVVSMANSGGGHVVFGVSDDGELVGVDEYTIGMLDPARIRDLLDSYSPHADVSTRRIVVDYYNKSYAALWVRPCSKVIVFDKPGDYTDGDGHQQQEFKEGMVYTRDSGGRVRASQDQLEQMVRRFIENRLSDFLAKIDQVAEVPPEADLLATHPQDPNQAYRLVARGEGKPVRIVRGSEESAVSLREVLRSDIPYEAADDEVAAEVRLWKTRPDHRVSKEMCFAWYLRREEISWDSDAATFCLRSACHDWGYPMCWGRWLAEKDPERLREAIEKFVDDPSWPEIHYAPFLAAAFLWDDCQEMLHSVEDTGYSSARDAAEKIKALLNDRREFLLSARSPGPRIRVEDDLYEKDDLYNDRNLAEQVMDRVVARRLQVASGELPADEAQGLSTAGHQVDLLAFAPRKPG